MLDKSFEKFDWKSFFCSLLRWVQLSIFVLVQLLLLACLLEFWASSGDRDDSVFTIFRKTQTVLTFENNAESLRSELSTFHICSNLQRKSASYFNSSSPSVLTEDGKLNKMTSFLFCF
jgi:hypothetical protein